ncbi:hypothetical protein Glove_22g9 [Diversispora epigaea]|uniref:Uncharacterized protein n=1 Tax=Diversispora epigaea TaxID=1348612 RepID=A0A397JLV5_9GLOM|nr:hypothetical protein Glove_22g9 [Diversispora epigaea]
MEVGNTESVNSLHDLEREYFSQRTTIPIYIAIKLFPIRQDARLHVSTENYLINSAQVPENVIAGVGFGGVPCNGFNLREYQIALPTILLFDDVPGVQGLELFEHLPPTYHRALWVTAGVQGLELFEHLPPTYHRARWVSDVLSFKVMGFRCIIFQGDGYTPESKKEDLKSATMDNGKLEAHRAITGYKPKICGERSIDEVTAGVQGLELFEHLPPTYHRARWISDVLSFKVMGADFRCIIFQGDGYAPESKKEDLKSATMGDDGSARTRTLNIFRQHIIELNGKKKGGFRTWSLLQWVTTGVQGLELFEHLPSTYHRALWVSDVSYHRNFVISRGDGYASESKKCGNQIFLSTIFDSKEVLLEIVNSVKRLTVTVSNVWVFPHVKSNTPDKP